jgi:hypothetical protein
MDIKRLNNIIMRKFRAPLYNSPQQYPLWCTYLEKLNKNIVTVGLVLNFQNLIIYLDDLVIIQISYHS